MAEQMQTGSDRERVEERVRRWCDSARLEGRHPLLSDGAAIAIAAGRLDENSRAVLAARRRGGKTLPSVGGFSTLRVLSDERQRWINKDSSNKPGSALVYRLRAAELGKRIDHLRTAFVMSTKHYANGVRAVRRERRDGVHLDLEQRDALFEALVATPVPRQHVGTVFERTGLDMLDSAADRVADAAKKTRFSEIGDRAASVIAEFADRKDDAFPDRYETVLFLAGTYYDRIQNSPAWRSDHFVVQRTQLDLADELTQVAVDVKALREIDDELDAIATMMFDDATRSQVASRRSALNTVWAQIIDRVAAIVRVADLVTLSDSELATMNIMQRAHSLDGRIDDLVARAGHRELSADNTHFVGDQLGQ